MDDIAFLENGDLSIVKGKPVYRAYIFSKLKFNWRYQWACKNSIELEKYDNYRCKIIKMERCMHFKTPHVITQWDLITRKFEMQYILNLNLREDFLSNLFEMNSNNALLAIVSHTESKSLAVCVYSTKSGREIANKTFSETLNYENYEFVFCR
ncbi:hypothetical protein C2G38_1236190 [Gigaspora rosea]|uniref:Uncharacterized protein n=1 Tax=Gigaspora rosea TaxID=44941 RepID=A0A397VJ03_9GLOM|nr:hypothetical protein C2G38_1236190 [Gigaspora rosea]